jgi:hypothetical protein
MTQLEKLVADVLRGIVESALRAGITPATVIRLYVSAAEEAFETLPMSLATWQTSKARRKEARIQKRVRDHLRACTIASAAGPATSAEIVAGIRETTVASVMKAKDEGRLLPYRHPFKGIYLFPVDQFEGSRVASWVPELIGIGGKGMAALHFLTIERKGLEGGSYLNHIHQSLTPKARAAVISTMLKAVRNSVP